MPAAPISCPAWSARLPRPRAGHAGRNDHRHPGPGDRHDLAVIEDEVFATEALTLATNLAARPAQALAAMKQAFNASGANSLDTQLDLERDLQRKLGRTEDFAEGVRAFTEKRPPVFSGK